MPWVRDAKVDFAAKAATVIVERKSFDAEKLIGALENAGFGGEVRPQVDGDSQDKKQKPPAKPSVTFHVIGMKKTKSGAT